MVLENFTTYTEVEPDNILTVIASRVTCVNLDRDIDAYVWDDKGAGHFGDFEHLFTVFTDASECTSSSLSHAWMLGNTVNDGNAVNGLHFICNVGASQIYYILAS